MTCKGDGCRPFRRATKIRRTTYPETLDRISLGGHHVGMLRLKELRLAHDPPLVQEKLAALAGVSVKTVARAERTGRVSIPTLHAFARALGVPIADLFGEAA
jgi:DNA-binding XRE family transcriptional regulator